MPLVCVLLFSPFGFTERPSSLHAPTQYRDQNPNNHHQAVAQQHSLRSNTLSKRQMLPASTAYAHDLANSSPDSNPPDEDARNQGYGGGGANNKNVNRVMKPPVYLPGKFWYGVWMLYSP